jgi:hypothetical protein
MRLGGLGSAGLLTPELVGIGAAAAAFALVIAVRLKGGRQEGG